MKMIPTDWNDAEESEQMVPPAKEGKERWHLLAIETQKDSTYCLEGDKRAYRWCPQEIKREKHNLKKDVTH